MKGFENSNKGKDVKQVSFKSERIMKIARLNRAFQEKNDFLSKLNTFTIVVN